MDEVELPRHLARLHQEHHVGDLVEVDLPPSERLGLIIEGAGFERARAHRGRQRLRRLYTLPDRVAADMRLLICGLNPSPASAESGVGFHRPGNRFWPAMLDAGLATVDRDPDHLLAHHDVGMTDIVKRTTRRAEEVTKAEFEAGMARLGSLVDWLRPGAVVMVGLQGWRVAIDRKATAGWQPAGALGTTAVYLMPSTSGLNAHETAASLAQHLRQASA